MDEEQPSGTESTEELSWAPRQRQPSIILKLDENGELKPLSDKMKSRLQEFSERKDWKDATGLSRETVQQSSAPSVGIKLMTEDRAKSLLEWLGNTKQMLWGMIGLSEEKRTEICKYSQAQKEFLAPPITNCINKHSPEWVKKYWDEIQLGLFMGTIEIGQFQACAGALISEKKKAQQRGPQPVRQIPAREPRTEPRTEPKASEDARTEVEKLADSLCSTPGCVEPSVPGIPFCRLHRPASESNER